MASIGDDDDRDLVGSQDGSSDEEMEDTLRDADEAGNDNDPDPDAEADADQDADSPSNTSHASEGPGMASQPNPDMTMTSSHSTNLTTDLTSIFHPSVRPECLTASTYDIVPTTAAPHSTSINAVTATADMRWVFSGGSDGYVRKFNWVDSINSKLMLTVAQRHPFVDSVIKAGVLMTYWESMDGNALSPVYSLASHSEGQWLLSGLESGSIRLQSVRHDEGKEIALLQQHTSAVSVLHLTPDEKSLLSGSWDKRVFDWDLNTGKTRRAFGASAGQIAAIEIRPESSLPVPKDTAEVPQTNGTYSSNYHAGGTDSFNLMDTSNDPGESGAAPDPQAGSPADSLFGGADSLFGDADGAGNDGAGPSDNAFGMDEDDEFGKALANGVAPDADANGEPDVMDQQTAPVSNNASAGVHTTNPPAEPLEAELTNVVPQPVTNGLPHAEELEPPSQTQDLAPSTQPESDIVRDHTFLAASIDGIIRVWDRRQPDPVARITPYNSPPWCMNACWSPDGNYIYAGRRNGTVEEFSLHKGLQEPERTFKFPQGSGPVTALKAMPNGRHIVCASHDILRLYDLKHEQVSRHSTVPFLIIPGHRTGTISQLYIDQACRFMISTSGNRGWEGNTTEVLLGYEINVPR
ncbi:WD40 repeat domain-containing protein [Aspergillus clavatus NRRL 1]|uniref:Transcription factor (SPT8), putative n=1 Tax=Aspergillus clavatus (strain ATCC 1007 / CBS 513.65 / DSM 816 / NCTC 3887 / NRRL 1 / QM 1276 / 107) TaxID=344612 RepID=A1CAF2_ASPCL|nr:transcription factor (SPT8), putative [Aspergillus clavatus NRRL 1]EAW12720.1 transcription factor (SPT8), putative [Aspergillus clavatus NRRL 1]